MKQSETNKDLQNLFKDESRFDINEIERVYNFIFNNEVVEGKSISFLLYDGKYGSGKSYKLDKASEYAKTTNKKLEITEFDSFQSGFNDNFSYILLLKIFKDAKWWTKIKKSIVLAWHSSREFFIVFPISLALTYTINKLIAPFNIGSIMIGSTSINSIINNFHEWLVRMKVIIDIPAIKYIILFVISYIITSFTLHIMLTVKKGYSISSRDYYYRSILRVIGTVLIIDDFERLDKQQRKQIYEFIDYCNHNPKILEKSKLKTVVLVGSHEHIKKIDDKCDIQTEPIVDKYFEKKMTIWPWIETFEERLKANHSNKVLNTGELTIVQNLLSYLQPVLSRRNFMRFLDDELTYYSISSFSHQIMKFLEKEKIQPYIEGENWSNYNVQINYEEDFLNKFLKREIPVYKTVSQIGANEVHYRESADELIVKLEKKYPTIQYLKELLGELVKNQKESWDIDKYRIFDSYLNYERYKSRDVVNEELSFNIDGNQFDIIDYYSMQTAIDLLIFKEEIDYEDENDTFIRELIREMKRENNLLDLITRVREELKKNISLEDVESELTQLFENFAIFNKNYIYNFIDNNKEYFDLEECEVAYKISESTTASQVINSISDNLDKQKIISYIVQQDEIERVNILAILITKGILTKKELSINSYDFYKSYETQLNKVLSILEIKNVLNYFELRDNNFFDMKYMRSLYKTASNDLILEMLKKVQYYKDSDFIFNDLIKDKIITFDKKQIRELVKISMNESQVYNRRMFKEEVNLINNAVKNTFKYYSKKQIRSTECGKLEIYVPGYKWKSRIKAKFTY